MNRIFSSVSEEMTFRWNKRIINSINVLERPEMSVHSGLTFVEEK